ncbi:hypothetical protein [Legionella sp. W05-934-2]|uniref:hypothetical protein n=1 Tax=Legionella sp. W05-934-2 TaxID=1198649 RepID=UPI0034618B31
MSELVELFKEFESKKLEHKQVIENKNLDSTAFTIKILEINNQLYRLMQQIYAKEIATYTLKGPANEMGALEELGLAEIGAFRIVPCTPNEHCFVFIKKAPNVIEKLSISVTISGYSAEGKICQTLDESLTYLKQLATKPKRKPTNQPRKVQYAKENAFYLMLINSPNFINSTQSEEVQQKRKMLKEDGQYLIRPSTTTLSKGQPLYTIDMNVGGTIYRSKQRFTQGNHGFTFNKKVYKNLSDIVSIIKKKLNNLHENIQAIKKSPRFRHEKPEIAEISILNAKNIPGDYIIIPPNVDNDDFSLYILGSNEKFIIADFKVTNEGYEYLGKQYAYFENIVKEAISRSRQCHFKEKLKNHMSDLSRHVRSSQDAETLLVNTDNYVVWTDSRIDPLPTIYVSFVKENKVHHQLLGNQGVPAILMNNPKLTNPIKHYNDLVDEIRDDLSNFSTYFHSNMMSVTEVKQLEKRMLEFPMGSFIIQPTQEMSFNLNKKIQLVLHSQNGIQYIPIKQTPNFLTNLKTILRQFQATIPLTAEQLNRIKPNDLKTKVKIQIDGHPDESVEIELSLLQCHSQMAFEYYEERSESDILLLPSDFSLQTVRDWVDIIKDKKDISQFDPSSIKHIKMLAHYLDAFKAVTLIKDDKYQQKIYVARSQDKTSNFSLV